MKYTKRDREHAAVRCQVIADYWQRPGARPDAYEEFDCSPRASYLSRRAYEECSAEIPDCNVYDEIARGWAEAEALIRCGWEPS